MDPAQTLTNAAAKLRKDATDDQFWCAIGGTPQALVRPSLAPALADWLEHMAEFLQGVEEIHGTATDLALHNSRHALAVARQVLGVTE